MLTFLIPTAHWHFAGGLFLLGDRARCKRNSRCRGGYLIYPLDFKERMSQVATMG